MAKKSAPLSATAAEQARKQKLQTLRNQAEMLEARVRVAELKARLKEAQKQLS